jgi:hypothetical protein
MGAVWAPEKVWIQVEDKNICLCQATNPDVLHIQVITMTELSWLVKLLIKYYSPVMMICHLQQTRT